MFPSRRVTTTLWARSSARCCDTFVHQIWVGMNNEERREACQILLERVRMDTLNKQLWLEPGRSSRRYLITVVSGVDLVPPAGAEPA